MPVVELPTLAELFGEPHQRGVLRCRAWAGSDAAPGIDIAIRFENGAPITEPDVPPSTATFCYRWVVTAYPDKRETVVRYTAVPEGGSVAFAALVDVDPASFEPVEVTPSLIETIDGRVASQIGPALDEYMDEHPLEGATTEYVDDLVQDHVAADTPHPAYDEDIPSLTLLFENGLV